MLQTEYNESLAITIELSLASPTFRKLGPNARDLLGVIAFFPQGIDENNLDWLFPTISNRKNLFDKFCVLSLTYRSNSFVTMLAPIRDYLGIQDPQSSALLCATRDHYFNRLSVRVDPKLPTFGETRWTVSEDANVEHLLDVFTSMGQNTEDSWNVCYHFIEHLHWHKPRQTVLAPKIKALPDDHDHKPKCLLELSQLFQQIGNHTEQKSLLTQTLELHRRRGNTFQVAQTLRFLSDANRLLDLHEEGIQRAKEASKIFEQINDTVGQGWCLNQLAWLSFDSNQLDAAKDAASRALILVPKSGQEVLVCRLHRVLGNTYRSKREKEKSIHHFETALGIASRFDWNEELFWIHFALVSLFLNEREFDNANARIEQAKSHAVGDTYKLGRAMRLQAQVWHRQGRLEDAKSEALQALEIFQKFGAAKDAKICRDLLQKVE